MMEYVGTELKPVRGGSLPLKTSDNATYQEVLYVAKKKREPFDRRFLVERGFVLACPDTSISKKIPGTKDEFVLKSYKEWPGKSYSRLTLYLSPVAPLSEKDTYEDEKSDILMTMDENNFPETDAVNTRGKKNAILQMRAILKILALLLQLILCKWKPRNTLAE